MIRTKPRFRKPLFIQWLAIPVEPKTRSQKFRAWLETWLPLRFGPRYYEYPLGDLRSAVCGQRSAKSLERYCVASPFGELRKWRLRSGPRMVEGNT
jgi:hypothetical protein